MLKAVRLFMKPNIMVIGNSKEEGRKGVSGVDRDAGRDAGRLIIDAPAVNQPADSGPVTLEPVIDKPTLEPAIDEPKQELIINEPTHEPIINEPPRREPVYLKDWGNERAVLSRLEGKLLADRRLYARVLYILKIRCNTLFDSPEWSLHF
jgi:hypothetical protein